MSLFQQEVTIEGSNVFIDVGNGISIRDRGDSLKLVTGTGPLFLPEILSVPVTVKKVPE